MKCSKFPQFVLWLVCAAILLESGYAGSNQTLNQGQIIRWKPNTPIPCVVNPGGVTGFTGELQRLVVAGAINDAFRVWTEVSGAAIQFGPQEAECGASQQINAAADGVNLVTFQDTALDLPPNVLGLAVVLAATATGTGQLGGKIIQVEFVGQIVDADIVLNTKAGTFSPVGSNNSIDLVAVAIHEVGHLLGLNHSGIFSASMNPFGESSEGVASRVLQSDDMITAAVLYPVATFAPSTGTISGKITTSTGAAVKSAHVIAVSHPAGVPIASQLSNGSGDYKIEGLPPGTYRVMVEPLDGPISLSSGWPSSFYSDGQTNFATTFFGSLGNPTAISLTAGQGATANVVLPATPANMLNVDKLGLITQTQTGQLFIAGPNPQFLPRGKSYQLFVTANNLTSDSNLSFTGTGITGGATTGGTFGTGGEPIRQQTITIASNATLGTSNLTLSNSTSTSAFPGGIVTTLNPNAATPFRDGAGFGTTLAPGAFVSIFGTDLAFGRGPGGIEGAVARPVPTSMGGVSVKIGNRFAPLFFVSPGQINALVPFETTGSSVDVTVLTGPGASGNTVTVSLSPTAPGIFSANASGTGQGAVLIGNENVIAAPTGSIPGRVTRPAKPGEVIVIYASGLGPVTPTFPSGLAAAFNGTPVPVMVNKPQVRIGGQLVAAGNVQFAGLAPTFVGLYQVNVQLPANVTTGNAVSLQFTTFEGQTSNTVTIAISP